MDDELLFRFLTGRATPSEESRVQAWRRAALHNEQHFQELAQALRLVAQVGTRRPERELPSSHDIMVRAASRVRGMTLLSPRRAILGSRARSVALAATFAGLGFALAEFLPEREPPAALSARDFVTGPSETATAALSDGTVVRLAPGSRLRLTPSDGRQASLTGRAYFAVAKEGNGPFTVHTAGGSVTVLGTRFDLESQGQDLRLIVVEGEVSLTWAGEARDVKAGQMARVIKGTPVPVVTVPEVASVVQWVGQFLAFQKTPLRDAVRDIERLYGTRIRIVEADLAERTITGWFAGWSFEEVMDVVCIAANAGCSAQDDTVTMAPR